ncbi:outer membrane protein assembly factor BamC [Chitinasiproducens palmae]|uniref:Beta-barrel assembly machine subunit BamC n=1 Tax=Chitinasiproducens palmae TaxID=1770053 RepID=A0A1H2PMB6_9BURK|nr:outer membrane protein assembly factor BamC [Chitinasiproducens palmae]SDV47640.1 Beta-barrel assembly machine subunit BamC [Chitinasiproducens palmae]
MKRTSLSISRISLGRACAAALAVGLVAGCSAPNPTAIDYKSTTRVKTDSMATPPNLIDEAREARALPPVGGETSLSSYERQESAQPVSTDNVLPTASGVQLQRDGSQRWLLVRSMPRAQLWELLRTFWQQQGFVLAEDSSQRGVMETDWRESRANVRQDLIRNTISKALDNAYVTAERNRYRTRIESAPQGGFYVFVSQKGMQEVLTGQTNENSQWRQRPNDPGLEAEYLQRLLQTVARNENAGNQRLAGAQRSPAQPVANTPPAAATPAPLGAGAVDIEDHQITLPEGYDRAWLRTGLALDRANFTVDDRDRERGLYFVRYVDPNDLGTAAQGFWNQLFHGKKEKKAIQYRINVRALTPTQTRIAVIGANSERDASAQADRILRLLADQMR